MLTKYSDYVGAGGDGRNRLAVLDPERAQKDSITGAFVMREVLTVVGITPDRDHPDVAGAVREWCLNAAAVDVATKSALVHSADGVLYRWDFTTNTLNESATLTAGVNEAYAPSCVGPDGTVYAINDGTLFAVGKPRGWWWWWPW